MDGQGVGFLDGLDRPAALVLLLPDGSISAGL
jgi:hypothetical protein